MARYYGPNWDWDEDPTQCLAKVDYNIQCSRKRSSNGLCWQHNKQVEKGGIVLVPKTDGFPGDYRDEVFGIDGLPLLSVEVN